jgi:hypothetical protein
MHICMYIYIIMYTYTHNLVGGSTPLNNMKISWDDYSQYMEKIMFQTTNQCLMWLKPYKKQNKIGNFHIPLGP